MTPMDAELELLGFAPPTAKAELRHILHDVAGGMLLSELARRFAGRLDDLRVALECLRAERLVESVLLPGQRVGVRWTGQAWAPVVRNKCRSAAEAVARMCEGLALVRGGMSISAAARAVGTNKGTLKCFIDREGGKP